VENLLKTKVNKPYFSTSLQVSPGIQTFRPDVGNIPLKDKWYREDLDYGDKYNSSLNIYFYGVELSNLKDKRKAYQADAISANNQLFETHFEEFHTYRLEWTPDSDGSIKWYLDGDFLYSIGKNTMKNVTGAQIPQEPMYLLLNTALSKTWGFPQPCPANCPCDCYDCRETKCACAVPVGMCDNFPAVFEIDYVRVYQNKLDKNQVVGCSTPDFPTSRYIDGHKELFMGEEDTEPLQPIKVGGGACGGGDMHNNSQTCHHASSCVDNKCICANGWVGPYCMATDAHNDIDWEPGEHLVVNSVFVPTSVRIWLAVAVLVCGSVFVYVWMTDNARRTDYTAIPY